MSDSLIRIATRKSQLAWWQANFVKHQLNQYYPEITIRLLGITTEGDKNQSGSLASVGGKGLFIKELETALLEGRADIVVHSMKDVPAVMTEGLTIGAVLEREDPRDVWISKYYPTVESLKHGATVGTCSLRRQCQLLARRPDLRIQPLRGNVPTRLQKCEAGLWDGIILAAAGMKRLDLESRIAAYFDPDVMLPAVGQGIIGIECRSDDNRLMEKLEKITHTPTLHCLNAERAMTTALGGSCLTPIGGYAQCVDGELLFSGLVGSPDGSLLIRATGRGQLSSAELIGATVANDLLIQGADKILNITPKSDG